MSKKNKPKAQKPTPKGPEKKAEPAGLFGFTIEGIKQNTLIRNIMILVMISLAIKIIVLFITANISFIDFFDINYYIKFASRIFNGNIPYSKTFTIDYPQGILLTILIPYLAVILTGTTSNPLAIYAFVHMSMMTVFDMGTVIAIYFIGSKIYDERRGFAAAILYATAISSAFFGLTKYDAFPTFLLMLSIALYIYKQETKAYIVGALAFIAKWFPSVAMPFFVINDIQTGVGKKTLLRNIAYAAATVMIAMVPFIILSPGGFIDTYMVNANVPILTHGFIYYLDYLLHTSLFGDLSLYLMVTAELALLTIYYYQPRRDPKTMLIFIAFAVFAFIILNRASSPQHLQWLTPFLAIFLSGGLDIILFYAIQAILYVEFPLTYGTYYNNVSGYGAGHGAFFAIASVIIFTIKFVLIFLAMAVIYGERVDKKSSE